MTARTKKIPVVVFERAKAVASTSAVKKPPQPTAPGRRRPVLAREKVVAALKKLHPMD
ncbi:MAG: hypothetical protein AMXMBFR34_27220 [Myxococcaceae bacterium]